MVTYVHFLALFLSLVVLSGCAGPIGVSRITPQEAYNLKTENSLGDEVVSDNSKTVLQRYNLLDEQAKESLITIQALHAISKLDDRRDILFALSELCYLQGQKLQEKSSENSGRKAQDLFLQSAVYAYFYLLGDGREPPPSAYDLRFREACDLYNQSLYQAFPANDNNRLDLSGGVRQLLGGNLTMALKSHTLS